jgi:hypothetical protein
MGRPILVQQSQTSKLELTTCESVEPGFSLASCFFLVQGHEISCPLRLAICPGVSIASCRSSGYDGPLPRVAAPSPLQQKCFNPRRLQQPRRSRA